VSIYRLLHSFCCFLNTNTAITQCYRTFLNTNTAITQCYRTFLNTNTAITQCYRTFLNTNTAITQCYRTFLNTNTAITQCYRTFPVLGWACNFPSAQQACRSFFRVIYVGGPLKGPQLTTTADTLKPTLYGVLSLILFVN